MKAKKSILKLEQFVILKSSLNINPFLENLDSKVGEYMENLPIDIDFDILEPPKDDSEGKEHYMVSAKININEENKEGYNILVEAAGLFSFSLANMPSKTEKSDLIFSGVNITITSIRNYITMLTAFSPFGQYTLPAIDMNDLIQKKKKNK